MSVIKADWKRNKGNIKGRIIMLLFRINKLATHNKLLFYIMLPYLCFYRILVEWFLSVELPWKTVIGPGLSIQHGHALVVNDNSIIGRNCTLRQSTTIGNKKDLNGVRSRSPIIGDNVDIGCNVCIIGPVTIGDNVIIGAGSVVITDIPANSIAAGNPARVLRSIL